MNAKLFTLNLITLATLLHGFLAVVAVPVSREEDEHGDNSAASSEHVPKSAAAAPSVNIEASNGGIINAGGSPVRFENAIGNNIVINNTQILPDPQSVVKIDNANGNTININNNIRDRELHPLGEYQLPSMKIENANGNVFNIVNNQIIKQVAAVADSASTSVTTTSTTSTTTTTTPAPETTMPSTTTTAAPTTVATTEKSTESADVDQLRKFNKLTNELETVESLVKLVVG